MFSFLSALWLAKHPIKKQRFLLIKKADEQNQSELTTTALLECAACSISYHEECVELRWGLDLEGSLMCSCKSFPGSHAKAACSIPLPILISIRMLRRFLWKLPCSRTCASCRRTLARGLTKLKPEPEPEGDGASDESGSDSGSSGGE